MKNDLEYIDKFYKENLDGYKAEAEAEVFGRLRWMLFWYKYKWSIGLSSIIILLALSSSFYFYPNGNLENQKQSLVILTEELQSEGNLNFSEDNNVNKQTTILITADQTNENELLTNSENIEKPLLNDNTLEFTNNNSGSLTIDANQLVYIAEVENDISSYIEGNEKYNDASFLLRMESLDFDYKLTTEPDTNILGYNRRTDVLSPAIKKQWFSLSIYAGPSASESIINGYGSDYTNLRYSNESNIMGWSLGTDLKFHIKNWIISTGLSYSVNNQDRSYIRSYDEYSPEESYFDYDTTWMWVFDAPDYGYPIVSSIDSSWVDVYDEITVDNSGVNQLKYLEVPLMIGYRFNTNMFAFEVNTGVSMGLLIYSNMEVPDLDNNNLIISADQMNTTMLNYLANLTIYYNLNRKTSLFITPYYKQNLSSVFNESYPVKQQFKTFGVNFGVNVLF